MQVPVLIEPIEGGRFRAHGGTPFSMDADGVTATEALNNLARLIENKLGSGAGLATITIGNGASDLPIIASIPADNLYQHDWVYRELRDAIEENRQQENTSA